MQAAGTGVLCEGSRLLWQFQQKYSLPQLLGQTSVLVLWLIVCLLSCGLGELLAHLSVQPPNEQDQRAQLCKK